MTESYDKSAGLRGDDEINNDDKHFKITKKDMFNMSGEEGADVNKVPIEKRRKMLDLIRQDLFESGEFDNLSLDERQMHLDDSRRELGLDTE